MHCTQFAALERIINQHFYTWRWQDSNFRSKGYPFKERCNIQEYLVWFKQRCRQVHIRHFLLPNNICRRQEWQHCRRANRWCNHWKKSSKDTWKTHRPGFTGQISISNRKQEVSRTVPTRTSWKASSCTTSRWYTMESTVDIETAREQTNRNSR